MSAAPPPPASSVATDSSAAFPPDEWANSLTHGIGLILSLCGLFPLILPSWRQADHWRSLNMGVFGISLVLLYAASTFYHAARDSKWKRRLRLLDHCAIYLLIAGSYTPFTTLLLEGMWGWLLFGAVWVLACFGILFRILSRRRSKGISSALYLVMGWLVVLAAEPVVNRLHPEGLFLLLAGGGCYTFGVIFYLFDRHRFYHAIWHLFVMSGSACHYCAVLLYL